MMPVYDALASLATIACRNASLEVDIENSISRCTLFSATMTAYKRKARERRKGKRERTCRSLGRAVGHCATCNWPMAAVCSCIHYGRMVV